MKFKIMTLLLLTAMVTVAQEPVNQKDKQGKRHGLWKGYYDEQETRPKYEGVFEHGKETGLFRFYQEGLKNPVATKQFSPSSDTVEVKFLAQNGKTISEGKMIGNNRIGSWTTYHKNTTQPMLIENYLNGELQGKSTTYYDNGQVAETAFYEKGKLQGERILYSVKGVVLEHLNYDKGELHGPAKIYNGKGELQSEGIYKRDKHHGIWRYYENSELKEEKEF